MAPPRRVCREEFTRVASEGKTNQELMSHFGVSRDTVYRLRKETGTPLKSLSAKSPEIVKLVGELLAEGWSHTEIDRSGYMTPQTIERYFPGSAWTYEERDAHRKNIEQYKEAARKLDQNYKEVV